MSKKQQEKTGGEAGKQPDQTNEQGQQELQKEPDQDKQPEQTGQGQQTVDEGKQAEQTELQGQQDQAEKEESAVTEQPPAHDKFQLLVQEMMAKSPLAARMNAIAAEMNAKAADIRRTVSIRTVNVPNNRRYRGGLCFTEQARVVNLDDLDEEQVKAILDDPYLKKD